MNGEIRIYVDCDGGSEACDGSRERPWPALELAQSAARKIAGQGWEGEIRVIIAGGLYELEQPLRFGPEDTGGGACRVVYEGAPGERPILSGGLRIRGWQPWREGIWRAPLPPGLQPRTLYAEGRRIDMARLPAQGYCETQPHGGREDTGGISWGDDLDLSALPAEAVGMQAFVWPGRGEWNWFSETIPVAEIDMIGKQLSFAHPSVWGIGEGSRYYLQGELAFLREPGQFHADGGEGWLYYWPHEGSPNDQEVIAPRLERVIEVEGESLESPARGLVFRQLKLAFTDGPQGYRMPGELPGEANRERDENRHALLYLHHAEEIEMTSCYLVFSGSSGIFLDRSARRITLAGNLIEHLGYNGIYAVGHAPGEGAFQGTEAANLNRDHEITDNIILHGGELVGHGSGIQLFQCGGCDIAFNRIAHMPRYGISLKGIRQGSLPSELWGVPVTWDNHWEFLYARNNTIRGNDISEVMTDTQDGGLIESWGVGLGNSITGNRLHHSGIRFSFGFGIYLDDASDGFEVRGNVLDHLYSAAPGKLWMAIFSKGIGNIIANNLIVDNPHAACGIGTQEMAGEENRDVTIERNLICNSGLPYGFVNWAENRLKAADHNLFWRGGAKLGVTGKLPDPAEPIGPSPVWGFDYSWETWKALTGGRWDVHSVSGDPLFAAGEEGGYRLRSESPAYGLGWEEIDFSQFGPRQGYDLQQAGLDAKGVDEKDGLESRRSDS